MTMINLNVTIDKQNSHLVLKNNDQSVVDLDCSNDLNFSRLVEYLASLLDSEKAIDEISWPTSENEKTNVAIKVIKQMLKTFNEIQEEEIAAG